MSRVNPADEMMVRPYTSKKRIRNRFGKIHEVLQIPNLIAVQRQSYENFLQMLVKQDDRALIGLQEVFKSVFPVKDSAGRVEMDFVGYEFDQPKFDVEECQTRGLTFAAPLKVTLRLLVFELDADTGVRMIRDIKEQDVYMGDIPLMTSNGTFVINGTERVIVSQMHRSPGVVFDHDKGKTHSSGKFLFAGRIIPYRGSWLDFEFDAKDHMYVRIDRRRKLPVTTLLYALDSAETAEYRAQITAQNIKPDRLFITGMSKEEILTNFYDGITYKKTNDGWKTALDAERLKGTKTNHDLLDAKTGKMVMEAGTKITARQISKLEEQGVKELLLTEDQLVGKYLARDIINMETGEVLLEAGDELSIDQLKSIAAAGVEQFDVLAIDHVNMGSYIRDTLAIDRNATREEALIDIYRVMRPGEPPTLEPAERLFNELFFDPERYDLSPVGRVKMNARLGFQTDDQQRVLRKEDVLAIVKILHELRDGRGEIDDIDNLGNRRVRSVGELLENQFRTGLVKMERAIRDRMSAMWILIPLCRMIW